MSKHFLKFALIAASLLISTQSAFAQMSDEAVIQYAKQQQSLGKDKNTIATELMAKGVTEEQVRRIQKRFMGGDTESGSTNTTLDNRTRKNIVIDEYQEQTTPFDFLFEEEKEVEEPKMEIFGHNIFSNKNLSFEPNQNLATPADYKLGPGDNVYIDVYGESEDNITATISPEGSIIISQIGPVYLSGLTVEQANSKLRKLFAQKYAGFDNNQSNVNLTLGDVRTILVDVMGDVNVPGTYRMSPFATVFTALYNAGGVTDLGSVRNVKVMRNGKSVGSIDLYDFIFKGKVSDNIRLQEGDVIMVPAAERLVTADGMFNRPMIYEMLPEESIADLISYAAGFAPNASNSIVTVTRYNGVDREMMNVLNDDFTMFTVRPGDVVYVSEVNDRVQNNVMVSGAVLRPGTYAVDSQLNTLSQLISAADGLLDDAFTNRAILHRLGENLEPQTLAVDLAGTLNGTVADINLQRGDSLVVFSITDLFDNGMVTINGEVKTPGKYPYAENTTLEDLIMMAGGLTQGASLARADVARRVIDPFSLKPTNEIAQIYQFALRDGYVMSTDTTFSLQPYDVVEIRRSPGYEPQRFVKVKGEVLFTGQYTLQVRNERVSDIIKRCGGTTESAFLKGASLQRRVTDDELLAREELKRLAASKENDTDSINSEMLDLSNVFTVSLDLEKALANPGSTYDLVLMDGDVINVPQIISTVSISGDVLFPNTVTYVPGKNYKYYVEQAGGFGEKAYKSKSYVVYMNGEVAKLKGKTPIQPGCKIVVPTKGESKGIDWSKIMSISTVVASLATMTATVSSLIK